jgi:protoporphyrinogen oxidase
MKKIITVLLLIFLSVSLISCEPDKYFFKTNTRNDEIVSIELISYDSDNVSITESTEEMLNFLSDNMEILEILDATKNKDFISEFSNIEFFQGYPHLNTPKGVGVKINYENGDFLIVTDSTLGEDSYGGDAILYNSGGIFQKYYGSLSWIQNFLDLINNFFETQID